MTNTQETDKYVVKVAGIDYDDERYYEVGDGEGFLNRNVYFDSQIEADVACLKAWQSFFISYELESFAQEWSDNDDYTAELWDLPRMKQMNPELVELLPKTGSFSHDLSLVHTDLLRGYWQKILAAWVVKIHKAQINDIR